MMTKDRAEALSKVLASDQERGKELISLEPADALDAINALGYDFKIEELEEFGDALKSMQSEVLDSDALDNVAGGAAPIVIPIVAVLAAGSGFLGYRFGKELGKKLSW